MDQIKIKTIFFVIATWSRVNFILRTDLFRILKEGNYRLVIISPFSDKKDFIEEFGGDNVVFENLPKLNRMFLTLSHWRSESLQATHSEMDLCKKIHFYMTRRFRPSKSLSLFVKKLIRNIILFLLPKNLKNSVGFWDFVITFFVPRKARILFKKYNPDAAVLCSSGAEGLDVPFILLSQKRKTFSISVDNNIDSATYRYFSMPWNIKIWTMFGGPLKQEYHQIHGISEDKLLITGALRYDYYFKSFKPSDREEFFKKIKADPNKKLITLAAKTPVVFPYNKEIINIILKVIDENKFGPAQLLVRFDNRHDPSQYGELLNKILWEESSKITNRDHLGNLLSHSDVVLGLGVTTLNIESCILGTPSIWIGFDGFHKYEIYEESSRFQYDLGFAKRMIKSGAIPLAETPEQLINLINKYLNNKNLDAEKREDMLSKEYFSTDGKTGERIAKIIIEKLK